MHGLHPEGSLTQGRRERRGGRGRNRAAQSIGARSLSSSLLFLLPAIPAPLRENSSSRCMVSIQRGVSRRGAEIAEEGGVGTGRRSRSVRVLSLLLFSFFSLRSLRLCVRTLPPDAWSPSRGESHAWAQRSQ